MIDPPRPNRKYSHEEVAQMRAAYPDFVMPGYVMRLEADGISFIHWTKASGGGAREDGQVVRGPRTFEVTPNEPLVAPPIQKRTPQERVDSLAKRLEGQPLAKSIEDKLEEVVRDSWRRGQPLTGEAKQALAATMLQEAEDRAIRPGRTR